MQNSLITIIIPVYNAERYLKKCLESIVNQTYKNIEILIINDGSTDSSIEKVKEYLDDSRVKIIEKENGGLSSARQTGIDNAKGEFLCTVDSDDWIEEDFIERLYSKISRENSDICVCAANYHEKGRKNRVGFSDMDIVTIKYSIEEIETNYRQLLRKYYMSDSWNKIYKMSFLQESGVKFTLDKGYIGTDLLFNSLLFLYRPQISVINDYLYNYQIIENSKTRKKDKKLQEGFSVIISKILVEVNKIGYSNKILDQIGILYLDLIWMAGTDLINTNSNIIFKEKYSQFFISHKEFIAKNRMKIKIRLCDKFSLKVAALFLNRKLSIWLYMFLILRNIIIFIKNTYKNLITHITYWRKTK